MKISSKKIFESFAGVWIFRRILSGQGEVNGVAHFKKAEPDILIYQEQGQWLTQNKIFQISRAYQYRYDSQTDKICVYFHEQGKEDRLFHEINLVPSDDKHSLAQGEGEHPCACDHYLVRYYFTDKNQFSLIYHVKGPTKNYTSETVFKRNLFCSEGIFIS